MCNEQVKTLKCSLNWRNELSTRGGVMYRPKALKRYVTCKNPFSALSRVKTPLLSVAEIDPHQDPRDFTLCGISL